MKDIETVKIAVTAPRSPQPGEDCCGSLSNFRYYDEERKVHVACCSYCAFECADNETDAYGEKPHKVVAATEEKR